MENRKLNYVPKQKEETYFSVTVGLFQEDSNHLYAAPIYY